MSLCFILKGCVYFSRCLGFKKDNGGRVEAVFRGGGDNRDPGAG